MSVFTKITIIGAGPAGITFFDKLIKSGKFKEGDILLIDKTGLKTPNLYSHGISLENAQSKCSKNLKFLVDGKITGNEIGLYFSKKYQYNPHQYDIKIIEKKDDNTFLLSTFEGQKIFSEKVILATGILPKKIDSINYDDNCKYNLTFRQFEYLKNINFNDSEIIFLGSGDNVACKASRLAKYLVNNNIKYKNFCIKIFVREQFKYEINIDLLNLVKEYASRGVIEVINNLWNIQRVIMDNNGLLRSIVTPLNSYSSKTKMGSYISIHIGFKINLPFFKNCTLNDFLLIGDVNRLNFGKVCTIYDAIKDANIKAKYFIESNKSISLISINKPNNTKNLDIKTIEKFIFNLKKYPIGDIQEINIFSPNTNKYKPSNFNFFKIETENNSFFLKRYHSSQINKILNEINITLKLNEETNLRIPKIITSIDNQFYINVDEYILVVYEFIYSQNLKDLNPSFSSFFPFLSSTHLTLKNISKPGLYDFNNHMNTFLKNVSTLKEFIINDKRTHAKRDIEYINFYEKEAKQIIKKLENMKIPCQIIHGDFLMQNILVETCSQKWWIIDWEKTCVSTISLDLMRAITFTFFDPKIKEVNLKIEFIINSIQEYISVYGNALTLNELIYMPYIYYFYLVTNIDFLARLYQYHIPLNEKMVEEDFKICLWFKNNLKDIQEEIINNCKPILLKKFIIK